MIYRSDNVGAFIPANGARLRYLHEPCNPVLATTKSGHSDVMSLADTAGAYWLIDASASHLDEIGTTDWFVLIKLQVQTGRAVMIYEDRNGHQNACKEITLQITHLAA
jgi:hypothetical protein